MPMRGLGIRPSCAMVQYVQRAFLQHIIPSIIWEPLLCLFTTAIYDYARLVSLP
jgi:hypothetical protein